VVEQALESDAALGFRQQVFGVAGFSVCSHPTVGRAVANNPHAPTAEEIDVLAKVFAIQQVRVQSTSR
jgi:hypothetical protein